MKLSFRQIHLDFHTSECIEGIGSKFDKAQFQAMLKLGHVSSITVFSKCHHGWAYHPSKANTTHPHLKFDLLKAQIEAAHEIGVKTPVYLSAGVDDKTARLHPEWQIVGKEGNGTPLRAGFRQVCCFNTPYLDYLLDQITEVLENYDADGIFLDIVGVRQCYCESCLRTMRERGWDPRDERNVLKLGEEVYANYTRRVRETVDAVRPGLPVFHNGGHIIAGRRDLAFMNTHIEMESLPTGSWGYDHFPMSVGYVRNLGMEMMGMTGKFHTSWGEFGGFKHKNALRYEAALSIANGAKCSVGDQLHPNGEMNETTYRLVGEAYAEVEQKEAWCDDVTAITDIGVLSVESVRTDGTADRNNKSGAGASRILLEGHYLFNVLDMECDFSPYKVIILPDSIPMTAALKDKLDAFTAAGGKILASGKSGLDENNTFAYDFGCEYVAPSEYKPAYVVPQIPLKSMDPGVYVTYADGEVVRPTETGIELAQREQSYFNRDFLHFCSHQHTPNSGVIDGGAICEGKDGIYFSWTVFDEYAVKGSLIMKELVIAALDRLLGENKTVTINLPAQGVTTLMDQTGENRLVHHILYASPVRRGEKIEVIEDILPILDTKVTLRTDKTIKKVYLAPQMQEIPFTQENGVVTYSVDRFECHQMIVLDY